MFRSHVRAGYDSGSVVCHHSQSKRHPSPHQEAEDSYVLHGNRGNHVASFLLRVDQKLKVISVGSQRPKPNGFRVARIVDCD